MPGEADLDWQAVQWFDDQYSALQFVLQCQPFDYQPDGVDWPEVKSREEALTVAQQLDPIPDEFVSTAVDFHRRLRIRHVPQEQPKSKGGMKSRHRSQQARSRPQKPWVVEQSGDLFERFATNLRSLKEPGTKYYIAVDGNEVFEKVLAEGFRVTKRTSIPCCSTPQDALAAMKRHQDNVPNPRAVVLTVIDLPLGKDGKPVNVIAKRATQWKPKKDRVNANDPRPMPAEQEPHGYLIQTNHIPANCFSKRKIGGTDAN